MPPRPHYGATPEDWAHFGVMLGLTTDLLPVVSNPNATIDPDSKVVALGKVPTRYNSGGRVVGFAKWTERLTEQPELDRWSRQPDYGICVQTREVRALDIDVADPQRSAAIVAAITDTLGFAPPIRRRGASGKCLIAVRVPGEYVKRTIRVDGGMVENLNNGQQFIAVGTHPSGVRYEWDGGLPEDFPTLTHEQYEGLWQTLALTFAIQDPSAARATVRHEKIAHAHQIDAVAKLLFELGRVRSTHADGRLFIQCPFENEHSTVSDERDTATAYWPAHTGGYVNGHFHCLHAHCEHRTDADFQRAIGYMPELEDFDALIEEAAPASDANDFEDISEGVDTDSTPPAQPEEKLRFPVETLEQFASHPPQPWIIKGVLPQAGLAVVYGESGSGKSFFCLDVVASIARGQAWRERKTRKGRVVYVVAEGAGGFRNRVQAYATQHGVALADVPLGIIAGAPNLIERKDAVALAKSVLASGGADVIVVDTLAQTTPGANENSGEDMGQVLAHCREIHRVTGALVLLVHHSGKDTSKGARGWSGLRAAADVEIEITRNESLRTAKVTKQKDGEDGVHWNFVLDTVTLGMDEDDDLITSCVVNYEVPQEAFAATKKEPTTRWRKAALVVAQEFAQDQLSGIEVEAIVAECLRRHGEDTIEERQRKYNYKRAIGWLAENDYFTLVGDCVSFDAGL
ncbi:AAA family ATPase [Parapusillimonas sp. JC17]|uniref:AAA family ATPase n=1 Tax=Parapusillimonas sp. JC17 TaxID=3445768 RepID=UPI003FA0C8D8